jgi:hypothetical protein
MEDAMQTLAEMFRLHVVAELTIIIALYCACCCTAVVGCRKQQALLPRL